MASACIAELQLEVTNVQQKKRLELKKRAIDCSKVAAYEQHTEDLKYELKKYLTVGELLQ